MLNSLEICQLEVQGLLFNQTHDPISLTLLFDLRILIIKPQTPYVSRDFTQPNIPSARVIRGNCDRIDLVDQVKVISST